MPKRSKYRAPETAARERRRLDAQMVTRHQENLSQLLAQLRESERTALREQERTLRSLKRALRRNVPVNK
jgi:hypothetical protein